MYKTHRHNEPRSALQPGRITRGEWLRFMKKVIVSPDGHWLWQAGLDGHNYARYRWRGKPYGGHLFAFIALRGAIPEGFELDHLCRIRHCVNPDCLEAVLQIINNLRSESITAIHARKTHCIHGHPFDEENTLHYGSHRHCRACRKIRSKNYLARRYSNKNEVPCDDHD
mgnify:CR=1 FL=1